MKRNTANLDRIIRLVLGVALAAGAWFYMATLGTLIAVVLGIIGVILFGTAVVGSCPIYSILGISTCKLK